MRRIGRTESPFPRRDEARAERRVESGCPGSLPHPPQAVMGGVVCWRQMRRRVAPGLSLSVAERRAACPCGLGEEWARGMLPRLRRCDLPAVCVSEGCVGEVPGIVHEAAPVNGG